MTAPQWTPLTDPTPSRLDSFRATTRGNTPEGRVFSLQFSAALGHMLGSQDAELCSLEADAQAVAAKVEASIRHDREGKRLADELLREVES